LHWLRYYLHSVWHFQCHLWWQYVAVGGTVEPVIEGKCVFERSAFRLLESPKPNIALSGFRQHWLPGDVDIGNISLRIDGRGNYDAPFYVREVRRPDRNPALQCV